MIGLRYLPCSDRITCFHSSNLLKIISTIGSQNRIAFEFPHKGMPKLDNDQYDILQSRIKGDLDNKS